MKINDLLQIEHFDILCMISNFVVNWSYFGTENWSNFLIHRAIVCG